MKWFGSSWGAPVCQADQKTATPVGVKCAAFDCQKPIHPNDRGALLPYSGEPLEGYERVMLEGEVHLAYHLSCLLKELLPE